MKRFIDDVSVEAIEAGLVAELGKIIDPVSVSKMPANGLSRVAGETEASQEMRRNLETELRVLKDGMQICRQFASFGVPGKLCSAHIRFLLLKLTRYWGRSTAG